MPQNSLIDAFLLNLETEFVNNRTLWCRSMDVVNSVVDAMNEKYHCSLNHINYDSFCIHARGFASDFISEIDLESIFPIFESEVLTFSPDLSKLSGEEFERAYLDAAKSLHQKKVLNLQLQFHRHCIEKCLKQRAPDKFQSFNIILDTLWNLQDTSKMQ